MRRFQIELEPGYVEILADLEKSTGFTSDDIATLIVTDYLIEMARKTPRGAFWRSMAAPIDGSRSGIEAMRDHLDAAVAVGLRSDLASRWTTMFAEGKPFSKISTIGPEATILDDMVKEGFVTEADAEIYERFPKSKVEAAAAVLSRRRQ